MKKRLSALACAAIVLGLGLALANTLLGSLNHDEGWYLLAARLTAHNRIPFRDFAYSQGPFLPYFYAFFERVWFRPDIGVLLSARLFTAVLGLAGSGLAAAIAHHVVLLGGGENPARRHAARTAALATWLLTACSPVHSYFSTIPKTYALTEFLLGLGFFSLALLVRVRTLPSAPSRLSRSPLAFNAGVFLGLAATTRLSFALVLPATCLSLWLAAPRDGRRQGFRDALFTGFGALFSLGLFLGRSLILDTPNTLACIGMHAARQGGDAMAWLSLRAGFVSRTLQSYPLFWALAAFLILSGASMRRTQPRPERTPATPLLAALASSALCVTLLHALAPLPYDDYQTPVMPFAAALLCILAFRPASGEATPSADAPLPSTAAIRRAFVVLAFGAALASPLLMDWAVVRKDRFWFVRKSRPDVLVLRDAGRALRELHREAGGVGNLFTQDAYLAVESGLPVSPRLAMGPFSFYSGLSNAETKRRRLLNESDVLRMLGSEFPPPVAATSGYTFAIDCPSTEPVPEETRQRLLGEIALLYDPVETIPDFGQEHTPLTIWRRKATENAR